MFIEHLQLAMFSSECSTWISSSSFQLYELTTIKIPLYGWGSESLNQSVQSHRASPLQSSDLILSPQFVFFLGSQLPLTLPPPHPHASPSPGRLSGTVCVWVLGLCAVLQAVSSEMALSQALPFLCWDGGICLNGRNQPLHIQAPWLREGAPNLEGFTD